MIHYKQMLKPTILFAAGSVAGMAHATVFTENVDISATNAGTAIAIGVPLSNAQFTFTSNESIFLGPKQGANLYANGTAGVLDEGNSSYIPSSADSFSPSVKTELASGAVGGPYFGLRFDVGADTIYGYATLDNDGSHISEIAYDAPTRLDISASVPEPAIWAEMILGFGLAGAALRRRRQAGLPVTA